MEVARDGWRARFASVFGRPARWAAAAPGRVNLIGEHVDYCDGLVLPMAIQRRTIVAAAPSGDRFTRLCSTAFPASLTAPITIDASAIRPPRPTATFADRPLGVLASFRPAARGESAASPKSSPLPQGKEPSRRRVPRNLPPATATQPCGSGLDCRQHDFRQGLRGPWASAGGEPCFVPPLEILIESDVPLGGGLSSSAALEAATALLPVAISGASPALDDGTRRLLARCCQWAEHTFAGVPCGLMDMLASLCGRAGHATLIDCRDATWEHVPLPDELAVLVVDTAVKHDHAAGAYARRRLECEGAAAALGVAQLRDADEATVAAAPLDPVLRRRALHVTGELRRVRDFVAALRRGDLEPLGALLFESHESLRRHFEVSSPELDAVVAAAAERRRDGVLGARLTGGGLGGCAIALVHAGSEETIGPALAAACEPTLGAPAAWFTAKASAGAALLDVA